MEFHQSHKIIYYVNKPQYLVGSALTPIIRFSQLFIVYTSFINCMFAINSFYLLYAFSDWLTLDTTLVSYYQTANIHANYFLTITIKETGPKQKFASSLKRHKVL